MRRGKSKVKRAQETLSEMRNDARAHVRYIRRNFDEAAILSVAVRLAFDENAQFNEVEQATIAAMQRAHPQAGGTLEELGDWLSVMEPEQIGGVVSNTKGVLHEMEFVRLENEDGDTVRAALFDETNHADYDIRLFDSVTGQNWDAQLKASDDPSYIRDWIESHPDGEIIVTSEMADAMGLASSGIDNAELTLRAETVVDHLLKANDDASLWDYFPALSVASIGLVVWELWRRLQSGEISLDRFKWLVARATGVKASKLALLTLAMSIPGLNVVTGVTLACRLLLKGACFIDSALLRQPIGEILTRKAK